MSTAKDHQWAVSNKLMRNTSMSGLFAPAGSIADRIHDGRAAASDLEDEIDEWWGSIDRISTDFYDNSLEVYFEDHIVDLEATPEQQQIIWDVGFNRFWLNFQGGKHKDGTERAYVNPRLSEKVCSATFDYESNLDL